MDYVLENVKNFDLEQIFECGQAFRFTKSERGAGICYNGVAYGKYLCVWQEGERVVFENTSEAEYKELWEKFFDLGRDYGAIIESISDPHAKKCAKSGSGIRILKQEPWETVCSFIISQNNNIPRIKKIIETLCERFGEPIVTANGTFYAFPTAKALYEAGTDAIFECRTGFRAKYIYDAAKHFYTGEFDLDKALKANCDELTRALMTIKGVGPKVAACACLFGFAHYESFPIDVWIKKVIDKYYPEDFNTDVFGKHAGIVQQYLFYYERSLSDKEKL